MRFGSLRPLGDIDSLARRYGQLFDRQLPSLFDENGSNVVNWAPPADVTETKEAFVITAELPGVDKDDIHVSVADGMLTIEGERRHKKEEDDESYHRIESAYGSFLRSFALPSNVDESAIDASCAEGVLRVRLPKSDTQESDRAREIKIS